MNNLKAKLKKEGGFTLVEMLIVVAIIAILIAIAIPMVNKALERAREATDSANERAALGLAMVNIMTDNEIADGVTPDASGVQIAYYEVGTSGSSEASSQGKLVADLPGTAKFNYGKGTKAGDIESDNAGKGIIITYTPATATADEKFDISWEKGTSASSSTP